MSNGGASVVCVVVKSRSVFPDLLPFETEVFLPSQSRAKLAFAKFGASCRKGLASLPQFDLCMAFGLLVLASA